MKHLSIDIETYSDIDIKEAGLFRYVESPAFSILMFAYAVDFGEVELVDLEEGETIPDEIIKALRDPAVTKHAFNAQFEVTCLSKFYATPPEQWRCTMVHAFYLRYSGGLAKVGEGLDLDAEHLKDRQGTALINYFSKPCKPTRTNGGRTRNLPYHDRAKWELFKDYCKQDVVAEMAIHKRFEPFPMPEAEWQLWHLDQTINRRGIALDIDLIDSALAVDTARTERLLDDMRGLTGLDNPNSANQLKTWLSERKGRPVDTIAKAAVEEILDSTEDPAVRDVLQIRQELAKTSVAKYAAMKSAVCDDGRVRGLLQFYGAGTGRWAGRLVQVQNLPRNYMEGSELDFARELVKAQRADAIEVVFGDIQDTLSQLIRTAFVPSEGHRFIVTDFSAIEARVIAWLAGESWREEVFKTHGKIYEASAAQMFGVPVETIAPGKENYTLRQKGKVAELALGYQGSSGALVSMGALKMGLDESELPEIVRLWRERSPAIVGLWYGLENAALETVASGKETTSHGLVFRLEGAAPDIYLTMELPSGRKLYYPRPELGSNQWGKDQINFLGLSLNRKWERQQTYGGKLTENAVQAIARDCLAIALQRLEARGYAVVMHIHDEVVIDAPIGTGSLEEANRILSEPIPWAEGLPLKGAGFEATYYKKD